MSDTEAVQCAIDSLIQRVEDEAAAEVWVRRVAAEEDLILVQNLHQAVGRSACRFRFVSFGWKASPLKPWSVNIYDMATKKQASHGYFTSTWEAALKVARVLGVARCRELEETRLQQERQVVGKVLRALVLKVEDEAAAQGAWHLLLPTDGRRRNPLNVHQGSDRSKAPGIVARRKLLEKHPTLQAWVSEAVCRAPRDLRKWSALQGRAQRASGTSASHGRSLLLVNAVHELQLPIDVRAAKVRVPADEQMRLAARTPLRARSAASPAVSVCVGIAGCRP